MKILFAAGQAYPPEFLGGSQISALSLAKQLNAHGHDAKILCALWGQGVVGWRARILMKLNGKKPVADQTQGVTMIRAWAPWDAVAYAVQKYQPDVVIIPAHHPVRMAKAAQAAGARVLLQLQDVEFKGHGGDFGELGPVPCVANSHFTARKYADAFGVTPGVVYPFIFRKDYETPTTRENVTFINPHPSKGAEIALALAAACPDIPFVFVRTWPLEPAYAQSLAAKVAALPNVTLIEPVQDMRKIYSHAKILLAPSIWEEAYGRIASEAHVSGIPVIGSRIGGLVEAIGTGGVLLDPKGPIDDWVAALNKMWHDPSYYNEMVTAAHTYAQRPDLDPVYQIKQWENALHAAAQG